MFRFSGFRDGHCHPLFSARESDGPILDHCTSVEEIQKEIAKHMAENPDLPWLDCGSFSPEIAATHRLHSKLLDAVASEIPVVVHAVDHHSIWVNSAALAVAGLDTFVPTLQNAVVEVDDDGRATGLLHEWDAMQLVYHHQPPASLESDLAAVERAQERLLAAGLVAVQEAWIDPGMPEAYLEAVRLDRLKIRVNLAPRLDANDWHSSLAFAKATRSKVRAAASPLLTCNSVKIFIDGVFGNCTSVMHEPYIDGTNGKPIWTPSELATMALAADNAGFQLHFHAIGDAAVTMALAAIEHVESCNGPVDRRPVIAHGDLVRSVDFELARRLGVIFCQQPSWAVRGPETARLEEVLGTDRVDRLYPVASLMAAGLTVSFGSDWPVSAPDPLLGLFTAQTRLSPESIDSPLNVHESISASQALECYSKNVAYQMGQEHSQFDDWVVLDKDPTQCEEESIPAIRVLEVGVAGRKVWTAG